MNNINHTPSFEERSGGDSCVSLSAAVVFISLVSIGIGLTFLLSRAAFELHFFQTAKTVLFLLLLVNGPLVPWLLRRKLPSGLSLIGIYTLTLVLGIGLSGAAGMLYGDGTGSLFSGWVLGISGASAFFFTGYTLLRKTSIRYLLILGGIAACFALWLSGRLWGPHILHPLFYEGLLTGRGFIDTLFHISVSQMIRTYGSASTGLDGLTALHYHVGSHWLFAQWSNLLGLPLFDFFILAYNTVIMPLFYFSTILLSMRLAQSLKQPFSLDMRTPAGRAFWLLFFILHVRLLPDRALAHLAIWETFGFSPSFYLGLLLLFLFTVQILDLWNSRDAWLRVIFLWIGIPLAIGLLGWMKNSVMILAAAGYGFVLLRQGKLKRPFGWAGLILAALVSIWTLFKVTNFGTGSSGLRLFAFLRTYIPLHLLPYHLLVYFGFLIFYTLVRIRQAQIRSRASLCEAVRTRKLLDLELLILLAALGMLPGLFLMISDGSAQTFSDVHIRLALPMILAQSGWIGQQLSGFRKEWRRVPITLILVVMGWKTLSLAGFYIKGNLALRRELGNLSSESPVCVDRTRFLSRLSEMDRIPLPEKRRMLIHMSKSDSVFWNHFLDREREQTLSLLVPAVSGIALLDGLPPDTVKTAHYGFGLYKKRERPLKDNLELCRGASEIGFQEAVIVSFARFGKAPVLIRCPKNEEAPE